MWIKILLTILIIGLVVFWVIMYRKKTIKKILKRYIIYDESEFYMLLSKYKPKENNIHKIYTESQHAIVIEEIIVKVGFFDQQFKKIKSKKVDVDYYVP